MNSNRRTLIVIGIIIVAVVVLAIVLTNTGKQVPELSYSELIEGIQLQPDGEGQYPEGKSKIIGVLFVSDYNVNILFIEDEEHFEEFKKGKFKSATGVVTYRNALTLAIENYVAENEDADLPYLKLNDPDDRSFLSYLFPAFILLMVLGVAVFMMISMRGGGKGANNAMNFGKTKARVAANVKVKFTDVAGAEEEKEELKEIVEFLKYPKKFRTVGARIPKGVLLVGPPGTGKTLFAKAVAGEASVPFFSISGSDFVEMFVGVGASRVRDLFQQAKRNQPCIVFIDEIDAVGRKRGAGLGGGNDEREQTLNQLLVQMDGFDENDGIVIMAATNRSDVLDPALLRPGRFDRQVFVNIPDVKGREAIFRIHSRNKPLAPDIDFKILARLTTGFSGADIENLLNEAAILAARNNRTIIIMKDVQEGINKVIAGPQKKSRIITEKDKRITAYHEAGHALVGRLMKECDAVQEVSIIPRGMAAGYTISRPKTDDSHVTKNRLNDEIAMMLGGRAAEAIVIQDISTGASQDIKQATSTARRMVTEWGMSESISNTYLGGEQEVFIGRDYQTQASYSDDTAALIDKEIKRILDNNYERALKALRANEDKLHAIVRLLFERETIYGDELDMILEGKSFEEVNAYIDEKQRKLEELAKERARQQEEAAHPNPLGNPKDFIVPEVIVMPPPENTAITLEPKQDDKDKHSEKEEKENDPNSEKEDNSNSEKEDDKK